MSHLESFSKLSIFNTQKNPVVVCGFFSTSMGLGHVVPLTVYCSA